MTRADLVALITREAPAYWHDGADVLLCARCEMETRMMFGVPLFEDQINMLVLQDTSFAQCGRCKEQIR